jgi:DNA-binding FadR family transcriptional regulator
MSNGLTNRPAGRKKTISGGAREERVLPLEAIEPRRLYRQIADQLRQLIDRGEYPIGSRLPTERELADQLGVSRPTVREALIALEVEGRLRIRVGSGIYVIKHQPTALVSSPAPIEGPFELLRARAFIESAVAEEAARRATDADIARLDGILAEIKPAKLRPKRWIALDRRFHVTIVGSLGNAVLVRFVGELFDQRINPYFERLARHVEDATTWKAAHEEHLRIRDAIAARDPALARAAMHDHLRRSHQRFAKDFGEKPSADDAGDTSGLRASA